MTQQQEQQIEGSIVVAQFDVTKNDPVLCPLKFIYSACDDPDAVVDNRFDAIIEQVRPLISTDKDLMVQQLLTPKGNFLILMDEEGKLKQQQPNYALLYYIGHHTILKQIYVGNCVVIKESLDDFEEKDLCIEENGSFATEFTEEDEDEEENEEDDEEDDEDYEEMDEEEDEPM